MRFVSTVLLTSLAGIPTTIGIGQAQQAPLTLQLSIPGSGPPVTTVTSGNVTLTDDQIQFTALNVLPDEHLFVIGHVSANAQGDDADGIRQIIKTVYPFMQEAPTWFLNKLCTGVTGECAPAATCFELGTASLQVFHPKCEAMDYFSPMIASGPLSTHMFSLNGASSGLLESTLFDALASAVSQGTEDDRLAWKRPGLWADDGTGTMSLLSAPTLAGAMLRVQMLRYCAVHFNGNPPNPAFLDEFEAFITSNGLGATLDVHLVSVRPGTTKPIIRVANAIRIDIPTINLWPEGNNGNGCSAAAYPMSSLVPYYSADPQYVYVGVSEGYVYYDFGKGASLPHVLPAVQVMYMASSGVALDKEPTWLVEPMCSETRIRLRSLIPKDAIGGHVAIFEPAAEPPYVQYYPRGCDSVYGLPMIVIWGGE